MRRHLKKTVNMFLKRIAIVAEGFQRVPLYKKKAATITRVVTIATVCLVLSVSQALTPVLTTQASNIKKMEKERDRLKEDLKELNQQEDELEIDYNAYNSRYRDLQEEVNIAEENIQQNLRDVQDLTAIIEDTQKEKDKQYAIMKDRIVFVYENRRKSLLTLFLESRTFGDFLNKVEYMGALVGYDQKMIDTYVELEKTVRAKKKELSDKESALQDELEKSANARQEIAKLTEEAGDRLTAKREEINVTRLSIEEFNREIEILRRKEREIANANAAAQLQQMQQIQQQIENNQGEMENNAGAVSAGESDVLLLAATIQAEADNQGYEGRLGVASVIMNRVNSSHFANSISGVVYQSGQFACVNYTLPLILQRGPNEGCIAVAREAIAGKRNTTALFFMTPEAAARLGQTGTPLGNGGHVFFESWR